MKLESKPSTPKLPPKSIFRTMITAILGIIHSALTPNASLAQQPRPTQVSWTDTQSQRLSGILKNTNNLAEIKNVFSKGLNFSQQLFFLRNARFKNVSTADKAYETIIPYLHPQLIISILSLRTTYYLEADPRKQIELQHLPINFSPKEQEEISHLGEVYQHTFKLLPPTQGLSKSNYYWQIANISKAVSINMLAAKHTPINEDTVRSEIELIRSEQARLKGLDLYHDNTTTVLIANNEIDQTGETPFAPNTLRERLLDLGPLEPIMPTRDALPSRARAEAILQMNSIFRSRKHLVTIFSGHGGNIPNPVFYLGNSETTGKQPTARPEIKAIDIAKAIEYRYEDANNLKADKERPLVIIANFCYSGDLAHELQKELDAINTKRGQKGQPFLPEIFLIASGEKYEPSTYVTNPTKDHLVSELLATIYQVPTGPNFSNILSGDVKYSTRTIYILNYQPKASSIGDLTSPILPRILQIPIIRQATQP